LVPIFSEAECLSIEFFLPGADCHHTLHVASELLAVY
jgi:hypothetical protein